MPPGFGSWRWGAAAAATQAAGFQTQSSWKTSKPRSKPPLGLKRLGERRTTALAETATVWKPCWPRISASDGIPGGMPSLCPGWSRKAAGQREVRRELTEGKVHGAWLRSAVNFTASRAKASTFGLVGRP